MSEQFSFNASAQRPPSESEVVGLLKKMQQQLVFLEKKIDALISQSQERPFRQKHFSKPYRSSERFRHHGKGEHGSSSREGSFDQGQRGDRDFGRERRFEKRRGDEYRGFEQKKRPFYRRKDRG